MCQPQYDDYPDSAFNEFWAMKESECQRQRKLLESHISQMEEYFEIEMEGERVYLHSAGGSDRRLFQTECLPVKWIEIPMKVDACKSLVPVKWTLDETEFTGFLNPLGLLVQNSSPLKCTNRLVRFELKNNDEFAIFKFQKLIMVVPRSIFSLNWLISPRSGQQKRNEPNELEQHNSGQEPSRVKKIFLFDSELTTTVAPPIMENISTSNASEVEYEIVGVRMSESMLWATLISLVSLISVCGLVTVVITCCDRSVDEDMMEEVVTCESPNENDRDTVSASKTVVVVDSPRVCEFKLYKPPKKDKSLRNGLKSLGSRLISGFANL
jgi:hypothetical protein